MAIGAIELQGTIARAQDFTTIKQHEDQKGLIDQSNFQQQLNKEIKERPHQVSHSDKADFYDRKFDAKEKGDNQYSGDGGKKRRQDPKEDGRVIIKGQTGFDVKI